MKKYKILIVEDEPALLGALSSKFSKEEFEVAEARDGEEGLEKALAEHPDLILLDIIMPKMDGMTMLERVRRDEWGKKVPVIILTNLTDDDKVEEAIKRGSHDYLIKSDWHINDVVVKVRNRLARR